jgi:adenylate kinase
MKNRIVLLGPPATGKGTQAALLSATFGIPAASTGAMMREERAKGSPMGLEAAQWADQGKLFPDELALRVVWHWIHGRTRFILDGFPRTVGQAKEFDLGLTKIDQPLDAVYFLDLPEEIIRERMVSRLTCSECSAVYNERFHNVTETTPCPACGGRLFRRTDDTNEALSRRMEQYREHTFPVVEYYRKTGVLKEIDARPGREAIFKTLYLEISGEEAEDGLAEKLSQEVAA